MSKPWRLSASVVVLAPRAAVPSCSKLSSIASADERQDYCVCMLKRAARSSFMPDTMVFPGGAVDPEDLSSASALFDGSSMQEAALRCAVVREAFEESGIEIFDSPLGLSKDDHLHWRWRVHKSASEFRSLCTSLDVLPAAQSLHYWCSFITPDMEHERLKKGGFDARFYVWCAPQSSSQLQYASADTNETTDLMWLTPDEALAAVTAGRISLAPPQWYILKELADFCPKMAMVPGYSSSEARTLQRDYPIKPYPCALPIEEQVAVRQRMLISESNSKESRVFALVYPGDESHPVFPGPTGARHRMHIVGELGKQAKYDLQRNVLETSLPLQEAQPNWYSLARL